jgi:hypothetical protein
MSSFVAAAVIGASSTMLYLGLSLANHLVDRTLGHREEMDIPPDCAVVSPDHPSGGTWKHSRS